MPSDPNGSVSPRTNVEGKLPEGDPIEVLRLIPAGLFIVTSQFEETRSGVLVRWVQPCGIEPPMVLFAIRKGAPVEPLIRDSRAFAVCQIGKHDRFLRRKFAESCVFGDDPFVSIPVTDSPCGCPVLRRAIAYLDCVLLRHVDLDGDCNLYIGRIEQAAILDDGRPALARAGEAWPPPSPHRRGSRR